MVYSTWCSRKHRALIQDAERTTSTLISALKNPSDICAISTRPQHSKGPGVCEASVISNVLNGAGSYEFPGIFSQPFLICHHSKGRVVAVCAKSHKYCAGGGGVQRSHGPPNLEVRCIRHAGHTLFWPCNYLIYLYFFYFLISKWHKSKRYIIKKNREM